MRYTRYAGIFVVLIFQLINLSSAYSREENVVISDTIPREVFDTYSNVLNGSGKVSPDQYKYLDLGGFVVIRLENVDYCENGNCLTFVILENCTNSICPYTTLFAGIDVILFDLATYKGRDFVLFGFRDDSGNVTEIKVTQRYVAVLRSTTR